MLVCHCRAVNDRAVSRAIDHGAHSVEEIGDRCGAGTVCGGCHPEIQRLLSERSARLAGAGSSYGRVASLRWRHG